MDRAIVLAVIGSLFGFLLGLLELRTVPRASRPSLRDLYFWLQVLVNPLFGGVLAYAYSASGTELTPLLALNIGVAAPAVVRGMAAANPFVPSAIDPGAGA